MHHRVGSAFAVICTLLAAFPASAQVAQSAVWAGPARSQSAPTYAQPSYPQTYAQPSYPQNYARPAYPQNYAPPAYPQNYAPPAYPQNYAPPAHPQAYAQRPYPQSYYRSGYVAPPYSAAPVPTPAAYGQTPHSAHGSPYAAPYYGPAYTQGNQVAAAWGAPRAEAAAPLVKTTDNLHYVEMGVGAFVPTDGGNPAKLGLEASFWAAHGGWVPNSGLYLALDASTGFDIGCMRARATDGCKGHLRIHWIGMGPFFNTGTPMIAPDVPRSWDLMALTGAEVRLWKGMTAKTTINWFVPNPWGVYDYERSLTEATASGAPLPATAGAAATQAADLNPMDGVESILGHALKHPQLNLMAMWEF